MPLTGRRKTKRPANLPAVLRSDLIAGVFRRFQSVPAPWLPAFPYLQPGPQQRTGPAGSSRWRSEEHTSEFQSRPHLVCRHLLEKKKQNKKRQPTVHVNPLQPPPERMHNRGRDGADVDQVLCPIMCERVICCLTAS